MPAKAQSRKVLDGRGEVLSYKRKPSQFFLRVYNSEKQGYDSLKIEGAEDIETACRAALDVYLNLQSKPKERILQVTAQSGVAERIHKPRGRSKRVRLDDAVKLFLKEQEQRVEAGEIKPGTQNNLRKTLDLHFLPFCEKEGLVYTRDIKVGCLDGFTIHVGGSKNSLRSHLTNIKTFLKSLARKKQIDPYEAALLSDITPKVKIKQEDLSANPPFRDEKEWMTFVKEVHAWVKEGEQMNNNRILYSRRKMWSLLMVLKQSGGRPDEILNMTWKDIETQDVGRISESQKQQDIQALREQGLSPENLPDDVQEQLGRVPRYITHLRLLHTKTGAPREVTCNSAEVLARWRKFQEERVAYVNKKHPQWNVELTPDTKVFDSPYGGEWQPQQYNNYTHHWLELMRRCYGKLKGPLLSEKPYTIYSLRSTRAMELLHLGVDVAVAAKSLGHSAQMMLRVYAQLPVRSQAMKAAIAGIEFGRTKDDVRTVELEEVQRE